jgi:Tol biopolymer transport system component
VFPVSAWPTSVAVAVSRRIVARMGIRLTLALVIAAGAMLAPGAVAQSSTLRVLFSGYVGATPRAAFGLIDGNRLVKLEDVPFRQRHAEISPDGTQLAFDTCRKRDRSLNVARIDGSDERRLVDLGGDGCVDIRWSRDSGRVSYVNPLNWQLHIIDVASATDTLLQHAGPASGWHAWSPAGDAIAFEVGRGGSRRIDVIDIATWRTRELVGKKQFGACEVWAPDWSPTSDRIVFTTCARALYVVNGDGSQLSRLTESAYAPRWAPDGLSIYFLSGSRLMRVAPSGGQVERLGVSPYFGGPFSIGPAR